MTMQSRPEPTVGFRRWGRRGGLLAGLLAVALGCGDIQGMLAGGSAGEAVIEARALEEQGDFAGAAAKWSELRVAYPEDVPVGVGHAKLQLMQGDFAGADATLASVEAFAKGDELGQIKLRRALVALRQQQLDQIKLHGMASGLPEGKLLAAEVHLVDLERDEGSAILRELAAQPGDVGQTAKMYTEMLAADNALADLAEVTALWALGVRDSACEAAEDLVKQLPPDYEKKDELLLLWASRAVTSGQPAVARSLLDELAFPPEGQEWRLRATQAMISLAEGNADEAMATFDALQGQVGAGVPRDGLDDALATACLITPDAAIKARLVQGVKESAAAARCLMEADDIAGARDKAPAGTMKAFLEKN